MACVIGGGSRDFQPSFREGHSVLCQMEGVGHVIFNLHLGRVTQFCAKSKEYVVISNHHFFQMLRPLLPSVLFEQPLSYANLVNPLSAEISLIDN